MEEDKTTRIPEKRFIIHGVQGAQKIVEDFWNTIVAIFLLLIMPNKKSIIDMILDRFGVVQNYYGGISYATLILIGIFLFVYLSSFRAFPKEKSTKLFAIISSSLMALTIISLIVFK